MKNEWFMNHFKDMEVYFGGDSRAIPAYDSDFIGFYLEAPRSAITHIGIVEEIIPSQTGTTYKLKAIIKLDEDIKVPDHAIRKQEYWTLKELNISKLAIVFNELSRVGGEN